MGVWKKLLAIVLVIALAPLAGWATNSNAETIKLKLGTKMPQNNPEMKGVARVVELVKERSKGRLEILPYYGSSLGKSYAQLENVMMGAQDLYVESYSYYHKWVPQFHLHTLPYLFKGPKEYKQFLLSDIQKSWEKMLLDKTGMLILNTQKNWIRGPYRVLVSKKPIFKPADVKGLKLRMAESKMLIKVWGEFFDANVINIAWNETYLALKQGIVEAVTSPIGVLYSMKFTEEAPYVMRTDEYNQQIAFVINNKKFQSLPADLQKILVNTIDEVGDYESKLVMEAATMDLGKMKKEHNMTFSEPDISPWLKAMDYEELEKSGLVNLEHVNQVLQWRKSMAK